MDDINQAIKTLTRTCKRCGKTWVLRRPVEPKVCPNLKCKTHYWATERKLSTGTPTQKVAPKV